MIFVKGSEGNLFTLDYIRGIAFSSTHDENKADFLTKVFVIGYYSMVSISVIFFLVGLIMLLVMTVPGLAKVIIVMLMMLDVSYLIFLFILGIILIHMARINYLMEF